MVKPELPQIVKDLGGKVFDNDCQQYQNSVTEAFVQEFSIALIS
jgi:hypothetical protein